MAKKVPKSQVTTETLPLDQIDEHPLNYNFHPPEQIAGLRASLNTFGQVQSIVVQQKEDGRYLFVAGHGLGEAARMEGFTELEARVIPEDWPPQKVLAYLAADNEHARRSQKDDTQLASLLQEVADFDRGLLKAASFTDDEFAALMESIADSVDNVRLREVEVKPPPDMAWVLVGIPLVQFGSIAQTIEQIAQMPDVIVETTVNNEGSQG